MAMFINFLVKLYVTVSEDIKSIVTGWRETAISIQNPVKHPQFI